jgi:hypothetical protein
LELLIGYASISKFCCCQLIGEHVVYQQAYNNEAHETSAASIKKKLSSELQKIQAFFHPDMIDRILHINLLKDRADHENGTGEKQTSWSALADLYNNTDKDPNLDDIDSTTRFNRYNHLLINCGYEDIDLTTLSELPNIKETDNFTV